MKNLITFSKLFVKIISKRVVDKSLRESEERLKFVLEGCQLGFWDWHINTGIVYRNKQWAEMLGYTFEEIHFTIKQWQDFIFEEDREKAWQSIQNHLDGKTSIHRLEYQMLTKKGDIVWILNQAKITERVDTGKAIRMSGTHTDITEKKEAELALLISELNLKELNTTKDKFFSIVAHDLFNPFNGLLGYSELVLKHIQIRQFDKVEQFSIAFRKSVEQAYTLLENLLNWSKSQRGKLTFNPILINLKLDVDNVMALILDIGLKKNIELYNLVEEDILVVADENMLDTMLRNLIFNAIKFIYDNGSVKVLAKKNETETILYVEDTGIGIKTENIERLFHLISDFTTPGTNNEKGTGLGLILCKDLIEKHNGEIGVHTKEGLGSTFWLSFPNKFK